jgi:hypothetical protein
MLLGIAGLLAVAVVGWQYWLFKGGIFRTSSFNQHEWKSLAKKSDDSSCFRGGMAGDIKENVLSAGMTKTEVEKRLGLPDSNKIDAYEYLLGMCSGLRIDFDTLDVHFDSDGKLVDVYIVQH